MTVLVAALAIVAFSKTSKVNEPSAKQRTLMLVVEMLEKQHYNPQLIDDDFSIKIFNKYLDELDGEKIIFSQTDVDALKKYRTKLDDEMKGKEPLDFLTDINTLYTKRVNELSNTYKQLLSKPFDFTVNEEYLVDGEKIAYPKNDAARLDRFRKKIKLMVLERYADLMEQRDKSVVDSIKNKTNAQLENESRDRVSKVLEKLYSRLKTKFTEEERFNSFVNVITTQMDPHTDFFPPVEKRQFDEMMSGKFYGIGAQLQEQDGNIKIASLMPAYPAQRSGQIDVNDVIVKVAQGDGEAVEITGFDVTDAVKLIRGKKDTEVKLTIRKADGTTKIVKLTRAEIVQDEAYARSSIVTQANGDKIGYIFLPDFYADFENPAGARCSRDVAKEIVKLKQEGIKGLVIDLRYNGGGSLYEVQQMVGLFIPEGPVVQVKGKESKPETLFDKDPSVLYDGPLTVMVNEMSASASEIFAAAIQDYGRGIIAGSDTYGKGTVQKNLPIGRSLYDMYIGGNQNNQPDLGFVKLTFQKFYRINGGSTQLKGVTPDVVIPDVLENRKIRERDNTASLKWDEVPKAAYDSTKFYSDEVVKKAKTAIANNNNFNLIKQNTTWLSKQAEMPVQLELNKYLANQKKIMETVTQDNQILKAKQELTMDVTKPDYDKFYNNPDKPKGERYQNWLKGIKTDIYIAQAIDITQMMISGNSVAKVAGE